MAMFDWWLKTRDGAYRWSDEGRLLAQFRRERLDLRDPDPGAGIGICLAAKHVPQLIGGTIYVWTSV